MVIFISKINAAYCRIASEGKNKGAADNHAHEELAYVAGGTFVVFFDEKGQNRLYLEPWDVILVSATGVEEIPRSFPESMR
jgi:hypothetical protein